MDHDFIMVSPDIYDNLQKCTTKSNPLISWEGIPIYKNEYMIANTIIAFGKYAQMIKEQLQDNLSI